MTRELTESAPQHSPPMPASPGSKALRILFMIDEMEALTAGGTERQVLQMIRLLQGSEFEPELCVLRGTQWLNEADAGCPIYNADVRTFTRYSGLRALKRLISHMRAGRFSILQTFFVEANLAGPVLAKCARIPVVIGSRRNSNYWMGKGTAALQRFSNGLVTRLQANAEAVKRVVAAQESVTPDKIDVLYNSLDIERFRRNADARAEVRRQIGARPDDIVITNVSALRHPKGMDLFLRSGLKVLASSTSARLLVVGDGPLREELKAMVPAENRERVYFAGAQKDVAPWLSASDVAVLSSESEGFSNSILEYMAAGLPVVATDVGGNAEALASTGILVPAKDEPALTSAVQRCVQNADLRQSLGAKARARVEATFAIPVVREAMLAYYRDLIGKHIRTS